MSKKSSFFKIGHSLPKKKKKKIVTRTNVHSTKKNTVLNFILTIYFLIKKIVITVLILI